MLKAEVPLCPLPQELVVLEIAGHLFSERSLPNPNPLDFDDEEFAVIEFLGGMAVKEGNQSFHPAATCR
jgi:hypothetical protein